MKQFRLEPLAKQLKTRDRVASDQNSPMFPWFDRGIHNIYGSISRHEGLHNQLIEDGVMFVSEKGIPDIIL